MVTCIPILFQSSMALFKDSGSVLPVGVRIQWAPSNKVSDDKRNPDLSPPAIGCARMQEMPSGKNFYISEIRVSFVDPTSVTKQPGLICGPISIASCPMVCTGEQKTIKSVSFAAD